MSRLSDKFGYFLDDCLIRIDPAKPFKPTARYNRDGDQLEVFWDDARCYAEDIGGMKIYRDNETNEIVGVTVYDVAGLVRGSLNPEERY